MILSERQQGEIRKLAGLLYSQSLDAKTLQEACPWICRTMDAHYFAFCRFSFSQPGGSILFSNNPPEFVGVYNHVQEKDFIMKNMVSRRRTISLRTIQEWNARSNRDFVSLLQKIRPFCDGIYVPAIFQGNLIGFWAIARAGLHTPVFTPNDFRIFELLSCFLSDAAGRSFASLPGPDHTAHLNARGEVLRAGSRISKSFQEIFGSTVWECPGRGNTPAGRAFYERFRSFLYSASPFSSRFTWKHTNGNGKKYEFSFQLQPGFGSLLRCATETVILVFQQPEECDTDTSLPSLKKVQELYELTDNEISVIRGIYKGYTNSEIGVSLGVSESTVKRRSGSIYEKTRAGSRSRLLFLLSR